MTSGPKHYYSGLFRVLLILLLILYRGSRMVYRVTGHKTRKELTNWCFRRVLSLQPTYTESLSIFSFPFPAVKSRFSWGQSNVLIRGLPPRLPLAAGGASVYPQDIRLELSTFASHSENGEGPPPSHRLACSEYLLTHSSHPSCAISRPQGLREIAPERGH